MSEGFIAPVGHANITNETRVSSVCGSESWRGSQTVITAFGIFSTLLSSLFYILSAIIAVHGRHDVVKKTLSVSSMISGTFLETLLLPLALLQMTASPNQKTMRFCLGLQVLQLIAIFVFFLQIALFFVVPLLVLKNPLRQTFLQSINGRASIVGGSWALSVLIPGAPGLALILTSRNGIVTCCGWHLFPKAYSFTLMYGCLFPLTISCVYASGKFVYVARQKARETAVPMSLGTQAENGVSTASRKTRNLRCRWLSLLLFHFIVSAIPTGSVFVVYLHCPFCVHPELMWYILNVLLTIQTLMIAVSNFSFKENLETFKRLFVRCNWRRGRVESF